MYECTNCHAQLEDEIENCSQCSENPEVPTEDPVEAASESETAAYLSLDNGSRVEIAGGETLFGRLDPTESIYPDVDLSTHGGHEMGVSRRHLVIQQLDDEYRLEDLGSANGTIVNEVRIQPGEKVALAEGDIIYLGRLKAVFHLAPSEGGLT